MALKDTWVDKVNGEDIVDAKDINSIAQAVIEIEKNTAADGETDLSSDLPLMNGEASPGTSEAASRADHVHPTDTTRMPAMDQMQIHTALDREDRFPVCLKSDGTMKQVLWGRMLALAKEAIPIPTNVSELTNDAGYITDTELDAAVDTALTEAKESGEFDGDSGVYVGSGDMPDNANVQVDPEGEDEGFVIPDVLPTTGDSTEDTMSQKAITEEFVKLRAEGVQQTPLFANSIEECTDTTKLYVLPDGFIYAYRKSTVETGATYTNVLATAIDSDGTPYNEGKGYKTGYRVNSSAAEVASSTNCCTGFIPCSSGDVVRIKNVVISSSSNGYFHFFDGSFKLSTSVYYENYDGGDKYNTIPDENGIITITIPTTTSPTAYFRITTGVIDDTTIVTINEEITESGGTEVAYQWGSTGHAFVPTNYDEEIARLRNITNTHSEEIVDIKKILENVESDTTTDDEKLLLIRNWDAPIYDANIPVFQLSTEKPAMTDATKTPESLYAMYDALMAKYPHYITKTDLGLCSDGVNHVYRYDFRDPEQRHYNNRNSETKIKVIMVSGIHYEWAGIYGLYYALEEIAENPLLRDLRRNTHFIVVPCVNPYTTIWDNIESSGGQQNANGIEIHRNFEVGFIYPDEVGYIEPGELHHGGTTPLSEVETQYIDNILKENTDAALFMTCHNYNLDAEYGISFIWPSVATAYMCNMGYRLIDKMTQAWMDKYADELTPGIESYRTDLLEEWDTRLGYAQISATNGTETRQATKYGIQAANVEICERFHVHGTKDNPEPLMSSFTMSRGAEVQINFLLTALGCYDYKDKANYTV